MALELREYLNDRDVPCPSCGYNLRGLTTDVCPECEEHVVLGVRLAEPKLKAFIAAMLGLAVGGGFSAMLIGYVGIRELGRARGAIPPDFLQAVIPGLVICGGLLAWLLWKRRVFCLWPQGVRVGCAMLAWGLALCNLAYFTLFVR